MGAKLLRVLIAALMLLGLPLALSACTFSVDTVDAAASVSGDVDDFSFESLDVRYTLGTADDGTSTLLVEERFVALFPDYRSEPRDAPHHPRLLPRTRR